eukprot:3379424-Prymnesium_polylepis.1
MEEVRVDTGGMAHIRAPRLLGRDAERAALLGGLEALREGRSTCVTLRGEAGMGKSRLVEWLRQTIAGKGDDEVPPPPARCELRALPTPVRDDPERRP